VITGARRERMLKEQNPRVGLARAMSKLGYCSRKEAWALVQAGRVALNGQICRLPERGVDLRRDRIEVDGQKLEPADGIYLMLNKPRGLVTTASDEQGRETVFSCLEGKGLPHLSPVGRLDKASEGLLLFTNDTEWAARITAPESELEKEYHVQVDCLADEVLVKRVVEGLSVDGDSLKAKRATVLRQGTRNSWLEIVLEQGKNRQIRRLLEALGVGVLRLIRVRIGRLELGELAKGQWRHLTQAEARALGGPS
jgi:23S rRNA pseudouridine2605 synthase